ncbi:MAG: MFS transporter [Nocardioidaceae bacterium]
MSALRHLVHLSRGRWFRRLLAVRLSSQFTDGVFQAALAAYVIFSPEKAPSPGALASAFAVVLLPFSVLGPFVGVFLDRWSRRQVLAWSNFVRVGMLLVLATCVHDHVRGPLLFTLVLVALSVNRFLLAGLSASLPHVVREDDLITANALTPTAGTLAFLLGLGAGTGSRALLDGIGYDGDVGVLVLAAACYGIAGSLALRIPRQLLGPDLDDVQPAVREAVRHVASGLVQGLRHLGSRRPAASALTAIGAHRFFYGISTVSLILLYRNYFHGPGSVDAAFNELSFAILVSGVGFVAAAVVTPVVTERIGTRAWVVGLLVGAAVTQVFPGGLYTEPGILVAAFFLGLASQGIKICTDTLVQANIDDAYRGRVFSLYDVIFNVAFVAAATVAAAALPFDGKSYAVLSVVAAGYLATGLGYAAATRTRSRVPSAGAAADAAADAELVGPAS